MTTTPFDFTPLLAPGLPPAATPWTGLSTYSFVGGNNDPDGVPLEGLIEAINTVLRRDGRALATYNLAHGPLGYRPLRDFLVAKLKRDAGISCTADEILLVSGSLQALDLVNKLKVKPEDNDTSRGLSKAAAAKRSELDELSGAAFDKAYLDNEVAYHKTVNGALETTLIPSSSNAELKALLQTGLKLFRGHQMHAEQAAAKVK